MSYDEDRAFREDADRLVSFDEEILVLPDNGTDSEGAWGERTATNDDRLLEERPPHWD